MVFDNKSDLAFYTVDKAMEKYVTDRINQLETESGAPVSLMHTAKVVGGE